MKLINESWKVLREDDRPPVVVTLSDEDRLDPKNPISLKDIARKRQDAEQIAREKAAKEAKKKEYAEKYKDLLDKVREAKDANEELEVLFDTLVPREGKAATVAGEIVRAMMRILYRDFNDGDKFYEGYGLESAGPSAAYLMSLDDLDVHDNFVEIAEDAMKYEPEYNYDDEYTAALNKINEKIIKHIIEHPELLAESNEIDSRDFDTDILAEYEPRYDLDFQISPDVQGYIDADKITENDVIWEVESWLDNESTFEGADVDFAYGDMIMVSNLKREGYETLKDWIKQDIWDSYLDDLRSEYGTLDGTEDEDED